jgi:hypothetical protein
MEKLRELRPGELTFAQAEIISGGINNYIAEVGLEMLPKTAEQIIQQYCTGQSVVLIRGDEVVFHSTGYEVLDEKQLSKVRIQVVELGSWIAILRGQGIGKMGAVRLLEQNREIFGQNAIFLATHKRMNALNISEHDLKFHKVLYKDFPYLTFLTCTCENCSENFTSEHGIMSCPFRATFTEVYPDVTGKIDCTLVISDIELAQEFERRCREESQRLGLPILEQGETITTERMKTARDLFDRMGS